MSRLTTIGAAALRIYTCHMLVFTIGAIVGALMGMKVTEQVLVAMLRSKGLL